MFTWAGRTLGVARLEQHSPRCRLPLRKVTATSREAAPRASGAQALSAEEVKPRQDRPLGGGVRRACLHPCQPQGPAILGYTPSCALGPVQGLSPPPSSHHVAEPLLAGACSRPHPFSGCTSCSACHGYGLCLSCHPEECPPHLPLRPGLRLGAPGPPVPGPAAWWGSMGAGAETEGGPWPERLPAPRLQPRGEEASTAGVAMALCCYLRRYVASKAGTSESY